MQNIYHTRTVSSHTEIYCDDNEFLSLSQRLLAINEESVLIGLPTRYFLYLIPFIYFEQTFESFCILIRIIVKVMNH